MKINAAWEVRRGKQAVCRWMVVWTALPDARIAGAVAGYSGGSSFVVERFVGVPNGAQWNSLWIDFTDRVSGKEVDFDRAGDAAVNACEQALDAVWEWNDNDVWGETDEVLLVPAKQKALQVKGNMLYLASDVEPWVRSVCELAGLTAAPETK